MPTIDEALALALQHHNAGRLGSAEYIYQQILGVRPDHPLAQKRLEALEGQRPVEGVLQSLSLIYSALRAQNAFQGQQQIASILADERYADPRRLERFGAKFYSQNDEDGIIREIFRRIGVTNQQFLEFGVENGLENNSLLLLHAGWKGVWLEASDDHVAAIRSRFAPVLETGDLRVRQTLVTRDNINDLIVELELPEELDLLSIDIDSNDYYVFEAVSAIRPRVVAIEYNAHFPPPIRAVVKYDENLRWRRTDYFGASLESLTALAERKGYHLVGCSITGTNAFFVRADLTEDRFQAPFTAENFYHPPRYPLTYFAFLGGHPADFGPYERL